MKNNVDSAFAAMKKLLFIFLALMRSTSLFADNYDCKIDGIYYKLDEANKTATVTKNGKPTYSGSIIIPNTITYHKQTYSVTTIGDEAFLECEGLTSVTIPNSVTTIGAWAFEDCKSLTSINVDAANTHYCSIDGVLFNHTKDALIQYPIGNTRTEYAIPNSVTTIGEAAFWNCNSLTSVTIPNSVTKIGNYAFGGCSGLTSINVDAANTHYYSIDGVLFNHTKDALIQYPIGNTRTEYAIPNSVTTIEAGAFYVCSGLTSITIPNSVTTIGGGAFAGCSNLTSITIPNSVTTIGDEAFAGCSNLTSITIPNSVTTIGSGAFSSCSGLTSITIPNSVTTIGSGAFYNCSGLTSVTIPNSVTTIVFYVFSGCSGLTSVTIPNSVTTIGVLAFEGCKSLTSITIPNSVTTIAMSAFDGCSGLTSVNVDAANTHYCSIDGVLFNYTKDTLIQYPIGNTRTEYVIPNSVTTIEVEAFTGCSNLTSVNVDAANAHYCSIDGVLFNYTKDTLIQYPIGNTRTEYVIPNSVTTIEDDAFAGCSNLTSITIPNSVTEIGYSAFSGCSGLTSVTILNPEVEIDKWAFERCTITDLYCGTSVDLSQVQVKCTIKNVHRLNNEELVLSLPFDQYARGFVEPRINEWQKKGEFEKTSDWQARVTETYRKQQIDSLVRVAKKKYLTSYQKNNSLTFSLGTYDADNEVYLVKSSHGEDLLVAIPITDASYVKQNWTNHTSFPQYDIQGTEVVVTSVDFTFPNNKTYTYHSSQNLTYAQADIQYNFDPIDLNSGFNTGSSQPKGRQTIQQTQLVIGKSDVDANIPKTNNVNDKTFVVILANEKYESLASVPFANNDGRVFREYCHKTLGIPEQNIHLRENATLNNMRSELGWLKQVCEAYKGEASVIFYYAGHGIPDESDKSAYLLPVDGDGRYVQSGYKLDDLYKNLGSMLAKSVTVFMDACFSGSQRGSGMLASARGIALKAKAGAPQGNMVVFSAAQGDETAYPNNEQGHGMFTYYLLKKLQETKGDVTLKDLGDYITTNVSQQSIVLNSKSQTPCVTPAGAVADSWQSWKLR